METKQEQERYWYEQLQATLNANCPITSKLEHIMKTRQIRESNKTEINMKYREIKSVMCSCGGK